MADLRPVYVAGDGDVKGPASSSSNFLPLFADTTGKLLKSSGTGVTTQGLAILDDNTPAEQRNTIGLDQVNNTSDVNKPVSTAQQTALNLKMNKTGDGAAPRLGSVSVNAGWLLDINQQGAYLFWNREGDGKTSLINNQGDGIGGFIFRNINKDNTAETGRVTIDGSGSLSSTGSITAAGSIYGANGAVAVSPDGNVNGSAWGGGLREYLAGNFLWIPNLMATYAANGTGTVGTYALMTNRTGVALVAGQLVAGSSLTYSNTEDASVNGGAATGTWRCMGATKSVSNDQSTTVFLRVT